MQLKHNYAGTAFSLVCLLVMVTCSCFGQGTAKKRLSEADYSKWGTLENRAVSPQGKWVCFSMLYDSGRDTVFIMNTATRNKICIPGGSQWEFGSDHIFAAFRPGDELVVANLDRETTSVLPNTESFSFTAEGKLLVTKSVDSTLTIRKAGGQAVKVIERVTAYAVDKTANTLSYITAGKNGHTLWLADLRSMEVYKRIETPGILYDLCVSEYGNAIAVKEKANGNRPALLHYYRGKELVPKTMDAMLMQGFPEKSSLDSERSVEFSADGKRLFFTVRKNPQPNPENKSGVEVWDSDAPWIYPKAQKENMEYYNRLMVWFPNEGRIAKVTDKVLPCWQLDPSKSLALLSNPEAYPLVNTKCGYVDYFLYDISTAKKEQILSHIATDPGTLSFSPDGKRICYFNGTGWWVYVIATKENYCILPPAGVSWYTDDFNYSPRPYVFGMAGWSSNGKLLYVNDEYDVYSFNLANRQLNRLTRGRETNTLYRIDYTSRVNFSQPSYNGAPTSGFFAGRDIISWSQNRETQQKQYHLLFKGSKLALLSKGHCAVDGIIGSDDGGVYVYSEQSYTMPPRLMTASNGNEKILYQSNQQQSNFELGTSELFDFPLPSGKKLKGILYYPAAYDRKKIYPMVVLIYSRIAPTFYDYINPSLYNETGFNIRDFVLKGYFVMAPDIVYQEGETGNSALECTMAATNAIVARGIVDPKRVGLAGHSFGGYETDYIVTQTSFFAAAVAGAGITDMVSWGFTVSKGLKIPELWRSEVQQWRIGKAFYQDKERYLRNSPLYYADQVETPLLTWTGKKEVNLPYEQNILFHNALRRAGKKNVMLVYPEGNHVMMNDADKIDLTRRIQDWFDKYLKPAS